jgi:hypothetical protein
MQFVKVQYDAYNRQFTLADHQTSPQLEDGCVYFVADLSLDDYLPAEEPSADYFDSRMTS